jgi:hypothetical protein
MALPSRYSGPMLRVRALKPRARYASSRPCHPEVVADDSEPRFDRGTDHCRRGRRSYEVEWYAEGERFISEWKKFALFDEALCSADYSANFPIIFVIMPTTSKWVVIWNNHFLCDGYGALCYNLTRKHGFTTMHWSAHD